MRFGRAYPEYQIPDWISHYVDYSSHKRLLNTIKLQQRSQDTEEGVCRVSLKPCPGRILHAQYFSNNLPVLTADLTRELAKVESFYLAQHRRARRRASPFLEHTDDQGLYNSLHSERVRQISRVQLEDYLRILLALLKHLQKLQWFGYVNYVAFRRIRRKSYKHGFFQHEHDDELSLKTHSFAHQRGCLEDLQQIGELVDRLGECWKATFVSKSLSSPSASNATEVISHPSPTVPLSSVKTREIFKYLSKISEAAGCSVLFPNPASYFTDEQKEAEDIDRLTLHYAAENGLLDQCRRYLRVNAKDAILTADWEGKTPLQLSILEGHTEVTNYFLETLRKQTSSYQHKRKLRDSLGSLLYLATSLNSSAAAQALIDHGADLSHSSPYGETALHIAARKGDDVVVRAILRSSSDDALVDLRESSCGRTPLIIACIEGHQSVVELLIAAGANAGLSDDLGWTAKEHAYFRGHLRLLQSTEPAIVQASAISSTLSGPLRKVSLSVEGDLRQTEHHGPSWLSCDEEKLELNQGQIFVHLGPSNTRSNEKAIDLNLPQWCEEDEVRRQTGFALEIDVIGGSGPRHLVLLPFLEDMVNRPIVFSAANPNEAKVVFRLFKVRDYEQSDMMLVGSGVAILRALQERLGPKHASLVSDHIVPILAKDTLHMVGSVTFSFQIVIPFRHPPAPSAATHGFWNRGDQTAIVGHRGSGANTTSRTNLQIGENTIQSFKSAVASGAACVEFDVQLTKDLLPVIFHDFLVMETGGDIPLHTLTRDQFLHFSSHQPYKAGGSGCAPVNCRRAVDDCGEVRLRPRSHSEKLNDEDRIEEARRRMKYTEEGRNDEIKEYPMLWEAEDRDMSFFATEPNLFVDTILAMVYRLGGKRSITFSSFSPEICVLLSVKQRDYPVLFINKAGSVPTGDIRAGNLQQAIHFAKAWGLAGIVMLSDVFVQCPRLLQYAKSQGLVCGSYGNLNDDPANAKVQGEAGLDAIIVNKVRLISQTLATTRRIT
ncbi:MAG: hypothetical protein Q9201_001515 [Fulgogasparrea decipioides]